MEYKKRKFAFGQEDDPKHESSNPLITKIHELLHDIDHELQMKHDVIPEGMQKEIDATLTNIVGCCGKMIKRAAGKFLHRLHEHEPALNDVKKVIDVYPEALLCKKKTTGYIPVQTAAFCRNGGIYLPLLAIEASHRNVGSLEKGGLLLCPQDTHSKYNVLQFMVYSTAHDRNYAWYDERCLQALKELRGAGLLLDQDIIQFNLIGHASSRYSLRRLEYLLEIYPEILSVPRRKGNFAVHPSNYGSKKKDIDIFSRLLTAGMQYFPENLGFIFQQNQKGTTPIEKAIDRYGKAEILQTIRGIISSKQKPYILHYVFRYTPDLCDDFVSIYHDAVHQEDGQGRSLLHIAASRGLKLSDYLLTTICTKDYLEERDPVTNLYPFMLSAASGDKKDGEDLTTIYKLLSLHPEVLG